MVRRLPVAFALASLFAAPAFGQEPPAQPPPAPAAAGTTRCGGILCDVYYANKPAPAPGQPEAPDPTHLPCHDFICGMFGGRTPDAPPPAVQEAAAPVPEPVTKTAHHKKKVKAAATAEPKADATK